LSLGLGLLRVRATSVRGAGANDFSQAGLTWLGFGLKFGPVRV
jgi:hypothetical protein